MVLLEMNFQRVVIEVVLLLAVVIPTIANMTLLVLVATVSIQLIISVESLPAETALGMSLESALINCARVVITKFVVLFQFCRGEQLVLMSEDLFVARTQIASPVSFLR